MKSKEGAVQVIIITIIVTLLSYQMYKKPEKNLTFYQIRYLKTKSLLQFKPVSPSIIIYFYKEKGTAPSSEPDYNILMDIIYLNYLRSSFCRTQSDVSSLDLYAFYSVNADPFDVSKHMLLEIIKCVVESNVKYHRILDI